MLQFNMGMLLCVWLNNENNFIILRIMKFRDLAQ